MIKWVNYFVRLCFLKAQPEEAPFSKIAQYTTVLVYWFLGVILLLSTQPYVSSIILSFIQTVIFLFLTSLVLWIKNLPERINQTITALMGTGAFITFVALPIVYGTGDLSSTGGSLWMLIAIVLLLWQAIISGNIFRFALDIPYIAGLGIALLFTYMTFTVTFRLMRVLAFSAGS